MRRPAARRALLLAAGLAQAARASLPACTWESCDRCLPDAVVNASKLKISGPDDRLYAAPLRIGRTIKAWDAQSIYGQIAGILVREKLGVEVEYVDCRDEIMCYMGVNSCVDWQNYNCGQLEVLPGGAGVVLPAEGKLFADPLSDIMFEPFIFYESMSRSNFEGSALDYDTRPGISIGPTGHTAITGAYVWPDVVARALEEDGVDLLWLGQYRQPAAVKHFDSPLILMRDGVVPEYEGCSSDTPFVQAGMDKHTALGWTCNDASWWVTPACAALGAAWSTGCVVMMDDDWGYVKPELYKSVIASGAPIAKVMLGYDAWNSLLSQRKYNVTFSWWSPDATVKKYHPRRIGLIPELAPQPNVVLKAAWSPALNADKRVQQLLEAIYMTTAMLDDLMDRIAMGFQAGHQTGEVTGPAFYQKVACDWVRESEDQWSQWFPSARSCLQGQVFNETASKCAPCPRGTFFVRLRNSTEYCGPCSPGTFSASEGALQCTPCPRGTFQSEAGSEQCSKCEAGRHTAATGQASCAPCPAGRAASETGTSECSLCLPGASSDVGAAACTPCAAGSFAAEGGSTGCTPCEAPRVTNGRGAVRSSDCVCPREFYKPLDGAAACLPCPAKMTCQQGSTEGSLRNAAAGNPPLLDDTLAPVPYPELNADFWSSTEAPLSVFRCTQKSRCPGGAPGTCAENTEAQACALCSRGFSWDGTKCARCSGTEQSRWIFPALPVPLLFIAIIGLYCMFRDPYERWNSWSNSANTLFFLALNHYQVLSLIRSTSIDLPEVVVTTFSIWSFSEDVLSVFKFSCVGFTDFKSTMLFKIMLPLAVLCVTLCCFWGSWALARLLKRRWLRMDVHRTWNVFFSLIFTFFNGVSAVSLSLFKCTSNPNGKLTLTKDPSVNCYESAWSSLVALAAFAVLVYCVGSIVAFTYAIWAATRPLRFVDQRFQMKWKFLFIKFRADVHWWSIVLLARGVLINMGFVVVTQGLGQLYWVMFLETLYLSLTIVFMPWRHMGANVLACITSFSIIYACALMAVYSERDAKMDTAVALMTVTTSFVPLTMFCVLSIRLIMRGLGLSGAPTPMPYEQLMEAAKGVVRLDREIVEAAFYSTGEWDRYHVVKFCEVIRAEFLGLASPNRTVSKECGMEAVGNGSVRVESGRHIGESHVIRV